MVKNDKCSGCGACYNACPRNCISMEADDLGFLYPRIDDEYCIHCGLCERVCPIFIKSRVAEQIDDIMVYGGFSKNEEERNESSSGGLFSLVAELVLKKGGVVFGAALSDDFKSVSHIRIDREEDLRRIRGSKYVQSNTHGIYNVVKEDLLENRWVLFSGTPCQIEGLNNYLEKEYSNLLTIELICHGVPSPVLFDKYISEMSEKLADDIASVSFRAEKGGNVFIMRIITARGKIYQNSSNSDPYFRLFHRDICLRESCYQCMSKGLFKRADITLSDFWGAEMVIPEITDGKGISLYIAHNEKAKKVLEDIKAATMGAEVDFERAIRGNKAFFASADRPSQRSNIERDVENKRVNDLARQYTYDPKSIVKMVLYKTHLMSFVHRWRYKYR